MISANGPTNSTAFEVGTTLTRLTASVAGELYLGVNDGYLPDNTGGWIVVVTSTNPKSDCSKLVTFDNSKLIVRALDPWYWTHFAEIGGQRYLYVRDGNPTGNIPYGIYINAKDALVNGPEVNQSDLPQTVMVQFLTGWRGNATYRFEDEDEDHAIPEWNAEVNPPQAEPLALLDAPLGLNSPFYPADHLVDSPEIHAPLLDPKHRRLTSINYTKDFKVYVGCNLKSDPTFHPVEVISWHAHYQGRVFYPIFGQPTLLGDHLFPVSTDTPNSAIGDEINITFPAPNSNCYTVYRNFNGSPTASPCTPAPK